MSNTRDCVWLQGGGPNGVGRPRAADKTIHTERFSGTVEVSGTLVLWVVTELSPTVGVQIISNNSLLPWRSRFHMVYHGEVGFISWMKWWLLRLLLVKRSDVYSPNSESRIHQKKLMWGKLLLIHRIMRHIPYIFVYYKKLFLYFP